MPILGALTGFLLLFGTTTAAQPVKPVAQVRPSYTVTLTAYNAVPDQTSDHPLVTASGAYSNPEIIAARSQDLGAKLPFGTIIELDGSNITSKNTCGYNIVAPYIGYRIVEDTMNVRYTNRIDVLLDTKTNYISSDGRVINAAVVLGLCKGITIRVVGHVNFNEIPKTQAQLVAIVERSNGLALR